MNKGLIGKKIGMTQVFSDDGALIPVTVIEMTPNRVTLLRTEEKDGYNAIQVTTGKCKPQRVTKPMAGHFAKANVDAGRGLWEFRVANKKDLENIEVGSQITVSDVFVKDALVDVTSTSKGKGFAGTVKRHNFATQDATHGNSRSHRVPGSIGQNQSPGRVFKGKKMCGHMGSVRCTIQNQKVVMVDPEKNILLIKGVVPGAPGSDVIVKPAIKASARGESK